MTLEIMYLFLLLAIWLSALTISIVKLYIKFEGKLNSTHSVQYVDPLQTIQAMTEAEKNKLAEQFEEI